jgi:hypothetical protein
MSISYIPNIPLSTNNPSVDQPNMETNTNSISSWVAVDHVGFNVSSPEVSGQHLQVTFNSNNVPTTPTSPPVLFTNTVGSLPQLFFYSGASTNQYTNGVNGSTFLLGGMILKWGGGTANSGAGTTNSFASAFPNACYQVIVCSTDPSFTGQISVTSTSTGSFVCKRNSGSGVTGISYIAIGY